MDTAAAPSLATGHGDGVILVLAPAGRDAALACRMLAEAGFTARPCRGIAELCAQTLDRVGAILLTEEALSEDAVRALAALLLAQPDWSDVPVVVFVDRGGSRSAAARQGLVETLGPGRNVILLERPVRVASFVSVMRSAVLARRRQCEVRDHLAAREQALEHEHLLQHELSHRVKNTLALVQAIAWQTRRSAATQEEFDAAFAARLAALARAHDLLTEASWRGALLGDVVGRTLAPHADASGDSARLVIDGPALRVPPNIAVMLNMALHELATNAAKYGALSAPGGRVAVRWRLTGAEAAVEIDWTERGGPPVRTPSRRGFGSRLIERGLAREIEGEVDLRFDPAGVRCRIRFPASRTTAAGGPGRKDGGL